MKNNKLLLVLSASFMSLGLLTGCQEKVNKEGKAMLDRIAYAAQKYDESKTSEAILEGSNNKKSSPATKKTFFDELHFAFKDLMGEPEKINLSIGQFENDQAKKVGKNALNPSYVFFLDKGIIGKADTYKEEDAISEKDQNLYIQRIHSYIGTSEVDDFSTAVNHDALFGDSWDESDPYYSVTNICDDNLYKERVLSMAKEVRDEENKDYKALGDLYTLVETGATTSIESETGFKALLEDFDNISTLSDFVNWEQTVYETTGSSFFSSTNVDNYYLTSDVPGASGSVDYVFVSGFGEFFYYFASYFMDDYSINNIDYLIDLAVDYTTPEYHYVNEFLTNYESMEEDMISSLTALAKSAHEYVDDFSNVSDINKWII